MIADLIAAGFHFGWAWRTSATAPAVCGVAIDVPDSATESVPLPISVDTMPTPGAPMSGLSAESLMRGPPELNAAVPVLTGVPSARLVDAPPRWARKKP